MSELEDIWHRTPKERHSDDMRELRAELTQARAELAAAKRAWECAVEERNEYLAMELNAVERAEKAEGELHKARADLAATRIELEEANEEIHYKTEDWKMVRDKWWRANADLAARDALLKEALSELRDYANMRECYGWETGDESNLIARIDALVKGETDDK